MKGFNYVINDVVEKSEAELLETLLDEIEVMFDFMEITGISQIGGIDYIGVMEGFLSQIEDLYGQ